MTRSNSGMSVDFMPTYWYSSSPDSVVVVVAASCVVVALHATDAEAVAIAALAESGEDAELNGETAETRIEDEDAPRREATERICVVFLRVFIAMDIVKLKDTQYIMYIHVLSVL